MMLVSLAKLPAFERALPRPEQISPKITRGDLVDERGRHLRVVLRWRCLWACVVVNAREGKKEGKRGGGEARRKACSRQKAFGTRLQDYQKRAG